MNSENPVCFRIEAEFKADKKSNELREKGNVAFNLKKMIRSLTFYNKSITFAVSKKTRALGFANRSAVYFELGRFQECLQNIEWARKNGYPKDKMEKLDVREMKCRESMENKDEEIDLWDFIKMSYPANEKIPWIVDCVELQKNKKRQGIYAKTDLKSGDIISIEKPLFHFQDEEVYYRRCCNCFKVNMMNLIPCQRTGNFLKISIK